MARLISIMAMLACVIISWRSVDAQVLETNSTNFHNLMFNRMFNMSRYHTYPFDVFKKFDFENFYKSFDNGGGDDDQPGTLEKIASMCGKLRDPESQINFNLSKYISQHCLQDFDYILCSLIEFIGAAKSYVKGDCNKVVDEMDATKCKSNLTSILAEKFWTIKMIDSFGKLESGINMGKYHFMGRYHDCKSVIVPREPRQFQAAYCRLTLHLPVPETAEIVSRDCLGIPLDNGAELSPQNRTCSPITNFTRIKWGICAPSTCDNRNMTFLFRYLMKPTRNFCNVTVVCETVKFNFGIDVKFVLLVTIMSLFGLLMIIGTVYDMFFYQMDVQRLLSERDYIVENKIQNQENGVYHDDIAIVKSRIKEEHFDSIKWYFKILMAFSVYTNGGNVLNVVMKPNELQCIHAVKALSIAWLISILAHIYVIAYIDNTKMIPKYIVRFCFQMINNGSFVADTFLLLSGFLLTYCFMKREYGRFVTSPLFWLKFYFRRWVRIFPPLFIIILFILFIWKYIIRGPMWTVYFFNVHSPLSCSTSFWSNFLFINNFVKLETPCYPVTQHLALEMQIFLFAPLILLLYLKFPMAGFSTCSVLVVISAIIQTVSVILNGLPPSLIGTVDVLSLDKPLTHYYNKIFIKPYMRCNAYIMGILLGHLVARVTSGATVRIGKNITLLLWVISITLCSCVVFGLAGFARGVPMPAFAVGIYSALSRLVWSFAVSTIIFLCATKRGGIVEWMFNWPFWAPISRISYSAFLISPLVIIYTYATSHQTLHLSTYNMVYYSWGCVFMTHLIAFVYHLAFEAPFLALRRMFCFKSLSAGSYVVETETGFNNNRFEEGRFLPAAVIVDGIELKNVSKPY